MNGSWRTVLDSDWQAPDLHDKIHMLVRYLHTGRQYDKYYIQDLHARQLKGRKHAQRQHCRAGMAPIRDQKRLIHRPGLPGWKHHSALLEDLFGSNHDLQPNRPGSALGRVTLPLTS